MDLGEILSYKPNTSTKRLRDDNVEEDDEAPPPPAKAKLINNYSYKK